MIFLGIISWKGASRFNGGEGCFSDGGTSFLIGGGCPMWGIGFDGRGFQKKNRWMRGGAPPHVPPLWETLVYNLSITSLDIFKLGNILSHSIG